MVEHSNNGRGSSLVILKNRAYNINHSKFRLSVLKKNLKSENFLNLEVLRGRKSHR